MMEVCVINDGHCAVLTATSCGVYHIAQDGKCGLIRMALSNSNPIILPHQTHSVLPHAITSARGTVVIASPGITITHFKLSTMTVSQTTCSVSADTIYDVGMCRTTGSVYVLANAALGSGVVCVNVKKRGNMSAAAVPRPIADARFDKTASEFFVIEECGTLHIGVVRTGHIRTRITGYERTHRFTFLQPHPVVSRCWTVTAHQLSNLVSNIPTTSVYLARTDDEKTRFVGRPVDLVSTYSTRAFALKRDCIVHYDDLRGVWKLAEKTICSAGSSQPVLLPDNKTIITAHADSDMPASVRLELAPL
jgi:hypothetical protein